MYQSTKATNLIFFCLFLLSPSRLIAGQDNQKILLVLKNAKEQTTQTRSYDPAYVRLAYPGGDVPLESGVCADVVVRAFRKAGVDLQVLVHNDMKSHFAAYPKMWKLRAPDANIDHRRVPNLMTFFKRKGKEIVITKNYSDYWPGDVVAWRLDNGLVHIGLVSDQISNDTKHPLIIHNIGAGTNMEDRLFEFEIIGHYRYF